MKTRVTVTKDFPTEFLDLLPQKNGPALPLSSMLNARIALNLLGLRCRYNVFRDLYWIEGTEFNGSMQLSDAVTRKLREMIRLRFNFDPGKENMNEALHRACEDNQFHPVLNYLDGLQWDGTPRIDRMLVEYFSAEDTPLVRAISRVVMIASVRRIRKPGAKFDYMTVLQSPEGFGKSSAIATLYGREYFTDQTVLGVDDKKLQETLRGKWAVECSELVGLNKNPALMENIKAAITRETDRARPAYGRFVVEVPRSMVMFGTTNDDEYLRAASGENRRFLPVTIERAIDITAIERDRDQLWAEAAAQDDNWCEPITLPEEFWTAATDARSMRTEDHPWLDVLENISRDARGNRNAYQVDGTEEKIAAGFILDQLQIPINHRTGQQAKLATGLMRSLGWTKPKSTFRINGKTVRGFVRPFRTSPDYDPAA